jgi:hypothetical protein
MDADRGEQERDPGERRQHQHQEPAISHGSPDPVLECGELDWHIGLDTVYEPSDGGRKAVGKGWLWRTDGDRQLPAFNPQPSAFNLQPSAFHEIPTTINVASSSK